MQGPGGGASPGDGEVPSSPRRRSSSIIHPDRRWLQSAITALVCVCVCLCGRGPFSSLLRPLFRSDLVANGLIDVLRKRRVPSIGSSEAVSSSGCGGERIDCYSFALRRRR